MSIFTIQLSSDHFTGAASIELTTDGAESSYGMPVAVLCGGPFSGQAFGPADPAPNADSDEFAWLIEPMAMTVAAANRDANGYGVINPLVTAFIQ